MISALHLLSLPLLITSPPQPFWRPALDSLRSTWFTVTVQAGALTSVRRCWTRRWRTAWLWQTRRNSSQWRSPRLAAEGKVSCVYLFMFPLFHWVRVVLPGTVSQSKRRPSWSSRPSPATSWPPCRLPSKPSTSCCLTARASASTCRKWPSWRRVKNSLRLLPNTSFAFDFL